MFALDQEQSPLTKLKLPSPDHFAATVTVVFLFLVSGSSAKSGGPLPPGMMAVVPTKNLPARRTLATPCTSTRNSQSSHHSTPRTTFLGYRIFPRIPSPILFDYFPQWLVKNTTKAAAATVLLRATRNHPQLYDLFLPS